VGVWRNFEKIRGWLRGGIHCCRKPLRLPLRECGAVWKC
jgi:hypothetical protein